jgi:hypothetical protein
LNEAWFIRYRQLCARRPPSPHTEVFESNNDFLPFLNRDHRLLVFNQERDLQDQLVAFNLQRQVLLEITLRRKVVPENSRNWRVRESTEKRKTNAQMKS